MIPVDAGLYRRRAVDSRLQHHLAAIGPLRSRLQRKFILRPHFAPAGALS
jgi:hypothetical protein